MSQFYRHSGIVPFGGLVQTLFAGAGTAISLGIAYTYAQVYIPFVQIHFILTLAFGFGLGMLVKRAARSGRIRNRYVPAAIGLTSGLVGLYFAWGADIIARQALPPNAGLFVAFRPDVLLSYMEWFYDNGMWTIGKNPNGPVKGLPLAAVWLGEAALIVGSATWLPWSEIHGWVFCENCGWWETIESNAHGFNAEDADRVAERLKQDDFSVLHDLKLAAPDERTFLRLHVATCATCEDSNYLDLEQVTIHVDKKGNARTKSRNLVEKLLVPPAEVSRVRDLGTSPAPEPAASEAAAPELEPGGEPA